MKLERKNPRMMKIPMMVTNQRINLLILLHPEVPDGQQVIRESISYFKLPRGDHLVFHRDA